METLVPTSWRDHVLLYVVVTFSLARSLVNGDSSPCTPGITMAGNQNADIFPGQPLVLKCRVRLCDLELPYVTWCKVAGQQCDPLKTGDGIYSKLEEQKGDIAVYVLQFDSVQMNNTGYYLCKAFFKDLQIMGKTVQLVISGESMSGNATTTNPTERDNTTKGADSRFTLLICSVSTMGGVCVFIIIVSLLIYCLRYYKVAHKSSSQDPAPSEELQFVAMSGSLKNCPKQTQGGTLKDMEQTAIPVEVTYDNAHLGYKSTSKNDPSPKEEDSIVYADLNYNSKKTIFQFEDDHEVEYATVHLNESREK